MISSQAGMKPACPLHETAKTLSKRTHGHPDDAALHLCAHVDSKTPAVSSLDAKVVQHGAPVVEAAFPHLGWDPGAVLRGVLLVIQSGPDKVCVWAKSTVHGPHVPEGDDRVAMPMAMHDDVAVEAEATSCRPEVVQVPPIHHVLHGEVIADADRLCGKGDKLVVESAVVAGDLLVLGRVKQWQGANHGEDGERGIKHRGMPNDGVARRVRGLVGMVVRQMAVGNDVECRISQPVPVSRVVVESADVRAAGLALDAVDRPGVRLHILLILKSTVPSLLSSCLEHRVAVPQPRPLRRVELDDVVHVPECMVPLALRLVSTAATVVGLDVLLVMFDALAAVDNRSIIVALLNVTRTQVGEYDSLEAWLIPGAHIHRI
mmetsp:Transcript_6535/g.18889  ORF Transcript_6535/g.18889 Transcript_6535/m.18889 type:complete len:375 (-) Transcript_6535:82-1206(-)